MATYPLAFVSQAPLSERLSLTWRQSKSESPHTFAAQYVNTASQWTLEFSWPRMSHRQAEICHSWLNSLQGEIGTFVYRPRQSLYVNLPNRSLATNAFSYSNVIRVQGWAAGSGSGLQVGNWFTIGNQLLQISSVAAASDGNGHVLIEFAPQLRRNWSANTTVDFNNARGVFRLASAQTPSYTIDPDRLPEFAPIVCREAI